MQASLDVCNTAEVDLEPNSPAHQWIEGEIGARRGGRFGKPLLADVVVLAPGTGSTVLAQ
ncbi:MAG: hypothetical protein P4L86_32735 [Mycobacterium sp.]|nr:hypothetical protein [Mycobacterium sp.]